MSEEKSQDTPFHEPALTINRVYTRTGDGGSTRLVGGQIVDKDHRRIEVYGTIDELNSFVGQARQTLRERDCGGDEAWQDLERRLFKIQHQLFNLGTVFATYKEDMTESMPRVRAEDVSELEEDMDRLNLDLQTLRSFVLPGGSRLNADLHICRTVCRRAERLAVSAARDLDIDAEAIAFLNRLSDAFFVYSRWVQARSGEPEVLWDPNALQNPS
jgi:cob(I)alamin adenosyltransferase